MKACRHTRRRRAATPRSGGQGMQSWYFAPPSCRWSFL